MKSGIGAGAIAGIVGGIVAVIAIAIMYPIVMTMDQASMMKWLTSQIGLNIIWGAVFGWIFSKVYDLIPGSGVTKGLTFSLMVWAFFIGLYPLSFFLLNYNPPLVDMAIGWGVIGFCVRLFYGPVLGALYKK